MLTPKAFSRNCHVIAARFLYESELGIRRNLALNPYDGFVRKGFFPHTETNTDLQIDETFAPRNAIDGVWANISHGKFPYQSWGTNKRDDAEWKLLFGKDVYIDEFPITLRSDFPHDNYWSTIEIEFSDGTYERRNLERTIEPQRFMIEKKKISWLILKNLKLSDAHPLFPALTQFEVWGILIDENLS